MLRKDLLDLIRKAMAAGWEVKKTGGGHLKWVSPKGEVVFSPYSPSDYRGFKNMKAHLRRAGLEC